MTKTPKIKLRHLKKKHDPNAFNIFDGIPLWFCAYMGFLVVMFLGLIFVEVDSK